MRRITKQGQGSQKLRQFQFNPPQTPQAATDQWQTFRSGGGGRDLLDNHLLPEQWGLCGYSELDADRLGLGFHIEHVENKSQNPARTFDYGNLMASAFSSKEGEGLQRANAQRIEVFGGHAPGKQGRRLPVDMAKFVSPLQPDTARFFAYLSNGWVEPALALDGSDQERARYTIDLLNLNSPFLVSLRRDWWDELDALFLEHQAKDWSLTDLAAVDLLPQGERLSRFFSLTRQFFGPVGERVFQQHAPVLL